MSRTIRNDIGSIFLNRLFGNAVLENHNNYFVDSDFEKKKKKDCWNSISLSFMDLVGRKTESSNVLFCTRHYYCCLFPLKKVWMDGVVSGVT